MFNLVSSYRCFKDYGNIWRNPRGDTFEIFDSRSMQALVTAGRVYLA